MERSQLLNSALMGTKDNFVDSFFERLNETDNKDLFQKEVQGLDKQLYKHYAAQNYAANEITKELYEHPFKEAIKLDVPKQHSLADSMLRSTLGSEEKYAQRYMKLIDLTKKVDEDEKKKRIEMAKQKFATSNSHTDFIANSKPFMAQRQFAEQRPVLQNQFDNYVKTHLTFLDKSNPSSNNKDYSSKFTDTIARKINQMGGIENTISPIENSLSTFQMRKHRNKEQSKNKSKSRKMSPSPAKGNGKTDKKIDSWLDKSKQMRQTLEAQLMAS